MNDFVRASLLAIRMSGSRGLIASKLAPTKRGGKRLTHVHIDSPCRSQLAGDPYSTAPRELS